MKTKKSSLIQGIALLAVATLTTFYVAQPSTVFAQTSAFTYQGQLTENGNAVTGNYDLKFVLFDLPSGGTQQGALTNLMVPVSGGLFTVTLDFTSSGFPGARRWLEISSRTNGGGSFTNLAPLQEITSAPYSITASNVTGTVSASQVTGILGTAQIPNLDASKITTGTLLDARIDAALARDAEVALAYQPLNPDLTDLADGSLTGTKVGTGINATNITTGTLLDGRLTANVALLDRNPQTFTGTNIFNGRVGIGTTDPKSEVHILRASAGSVTPSTSSLLTLENDTSVFIHILGATNSNSGILFGSALTANDASIRYNNGNDRELSFRTLNSTRMVISTNGFLGINTLDPTNTLHVVGGGTVTGDALVGGLTVGGGANVTRILSTTASLDFPSTVTNSSSDLTITLTGAALGDAVFLGVPSFSTITGTAYWAFVSAADTVTVRFVNARSTAQNPGAGTFRVAIMQF